MPPLPSRKSLEAMKRVDLQKICKDYGVKANLKSEALIDLLLDTQSTPAPPPQPTRRSVSTRQSRQAGPSRVSSMIVYDISEGDEDEGSKEEAKGQDDEQAKAPSLPLPPRTRKKAKELQTRLGVGKPVIAGGSGPRAVTRSSGSSRGKRAKSSKSMNPTEATIEEEPEPPANSLQITSTVPYIPQEESTLLVETMPPVNSITLHGDAKKLVDDAIRPLQEQIQELKTELSGATAMKSQIAGLQSQLADFTKAQSDLRTQLQQLSEVTSIVVALKDEIRQLREATRPPSQPSTPKAGSSRQGLIGLGPPPFKAMAVPSHQASSSSQSRPNPSLPHPGVAESTLGKRHREATSSIITDVVEEGQEDGCSETEMANKVIRPAKKRPKMSKDDDGQKTVGHRDSSESDIHPVASSSRHALPSFTVFRGSEEPSDYIDPPPPTDHLPDFFEPDSAPSNNQGSRFTSGVPTSSASAEENQPFNFAFAPISSTPHGAMYLPTFPYPDPPQSPSPAGPSSLAFPSRHQEERTDIFKTFGLPSPMRSTRHYGALTQDERGVNPAALTQGSSLSKRDITSNDVAVGLGLTAVRTASSSEPPSVDQPTIKRTMFGTELEADTRFGDFGVEGVASGFWSTKY